MASGVEDMVAAALTELSGDQQGLCDFLTEYFGSAEAQELGKP